MVSAYIHPNSWKTLLLQSEKITAENVANFEFWAHIWITHMYTWHQRVYVLLLYYYIFHRKLSITFIVLSSLLECSIRNCEEAMLTVVSSVPCKMRKGIWISETLRCIKRCALIVARVHFALIPWWYTRGSSCLSWICNRTN